MSSTRLPSCVERRTIGVSSPQCRNNGQFQNPEYPRTMRYSFPFAKIHRPDPACFQTLGSLALENTMLQIHSKLILRQHPHLLLDIVLHSLSPPHPLPDLAYEEHRITTE
jgi:hypothetical protein